MRIGESDDRGIMLFYELLNEKENGRSILSSFLSSLITKKTDMFYFSVILFDGENILLKALGHIFLFYLVVLCSF